MDEGRITGIERRNGEVLWGIFSRRHHLGSLRRVVVIFRVLFVYLFPSLSCISFSSQLERERITETLIYARTTRKKVNNKEKLSEFRLCHTIFLTLRSVVGNRSLVNNSYNRKKVEQRNRANRSRRVRPFNESVLWLFVLLLFNFHDRR